MRTSRLLRATSFRLALLQTLVFLAAFVVAAAIAVAIVRRTEIQAVDAEVAEEVDDLRAIFARGGLPPLQATIAARQRDPSIWEFRVETPSHVHLAGDLPPLTYPPGWSKVRLVEGDLPDNASEVVRLFSTPLAGGLRLMVGEDLGQREKADNALLILLASLLAAAVMVSLAVGAFAGRRVLRRVDAMSQAMERFGVGDLQARTVASSHAPSDLDDLALALNRMMDRTASLMGGLRQISADIAHDLRRPLARHNQTISRVLQEPPSLIAYRAALETAEAEVDDVLRTFQSLLHIAELEAGAPGLELQPVDLREVAGRIVQAYAPSAEEGGRTLVLRAPLETHPPVTVVGEPRLLGQMIANLIDNALTHTPVGTRVEVAVEPQPPRLVVSDDGPGVPDDMRTRIFERFVRLDASRTSPGSGLGLALSSAIAAISGGEIAAENIRPGLQVSVVFKKLAKSQ